MLRAKTRFSHTRRRGVKAYPELGDARITRRENSLGRLGAGPIRLSKPFLRVSCSACTTPSLNTSTYNNECKRLVLPVFLVIVFNGFLF